MSLYDRLPNLLEGINRLANETGIRRRITICAPCPSGAKAHFVARRVDHAPPVFG